MFLCLTYITVATTITACSIFFSAHNGDIQITTFIHTQLHKRVIEFLLTLARFVLSFHIRTFSVWWRSRLLENFFFDYFVVCIVLVTFANLAIAHACCCWFGCSIYLLLYIVVVCVVYTLPFVAFDFVAFSLSISSIVILMLVWVYL